ncbi:hypothetical protein FJD12_25425 [Escherichia coli]|nr:hypothetical protein [Escherichia coli]
MKKTAPDGAVSGMPAIRETGPGKNLQAITVSTGFTILILVPSFIFIRLFQHTVSHRTKQRVQALHISQ